MIFCAADKRATYDAYGKEGLKGGMGAGGKTLVLNHWNEATPTFKDSLKDVPKYAWY